MRFPEVEYMTWAKTMHPARINLARSGLTPCPPSLLGLTPHDLVTHHPAGYGYPPLLKALGRRYGVAADRVFTVPGGASLANWMACAAALEGARAGDEVIVERPTYEPLLRIAQAHGCRVRRLDRRFAQGYAIDLGRFASLVNRRTRLALVTNLHNPSGMRIDRRTLAEMARILKRAGALFVVDEVYLECLFGDRAADSSVHAGDNVIATNSLTKAYGLDGLRAGWILGPRDLIHRAGKIYDLMGVNGVAPGERMTLAALKHLRAVAGRARDILAPNLDRVRRFLGSEPRLRAHVPPGGTVVFAHLPEGLDGDRFARHLLRRHATLVVPGRFFESPSCIRISFGCEPGVLRQGLAGIRQALDEISSERPSTTDRSTGSGRMRKP